MCHWVSGEVELGGGAWAVGPPEGRDPRAGRSGKGRWGRGNQAEMTDTERGGAQWDPGGGERRGGEQPREAEREGRGKGQGTEVDRVEAGSLGHEGSSHLAYLQSQVRSAA